MIRNVTFGVILAASVTASSVQADSVHLVNGDLIKGALVSLDDQHAVISSELLGKMTIDRDKLKAIYFGEEVAQQRPDGAGEARLDRQIPRTPEELIEELSGRTGSEKKPSQSGVDLQKMLQEGNLDLHGLQGLQESLPLLNEPEVQKQFQSYLQGLMTGELTIDDIRKDAADARDGIKQLQKELGPRGQALNGYLDILDGFIDEAAPSDVPN